LGASSDSELLEYTSAESR